MLIFNTHNVGEKNQRRADRKRQAAAARFFLRVGKVAAENARWDNDLTMPLFSLPLILQADGTLAADARGVLETPLKPG